MNQHLSLMTAPKPGLSKVGSSLAPGTISAKFWFSLSNCIQKDESGLGGSVFLKVIANVTFADCSFRPSFRDTQCFCATVGGTNLCQSSRYTGNDKVPEQIMQIKSQRQARAYLFTFEVIWSLSSATAVVLLSKLQASVAFF